MNAVLALPRLSPGIPSSVQRLGRRRANAALARFLVEAGVLRAVDVPATWSDALEVCQRALDGWVKRQIGPLHCLSPLFVLCAEDGETHTSRRYEHETYASARLAWLEANEQQWVVGPGLEALERAQPGLGGAVLGALASQHVVYPLFTPETACDIVSYLHWCGEDDEEAALDVQCGDDPQERAEMREQMITRAMLNEAYPPWAQRWVPLRARQLGLKTLAPGVCEPHLRAIVDDAIALTRLRLDSRFRPDIEGEFIGWGAVLSWAEDDLTVRVYDDLVNHAHQSEYCDVMGEVELPLDQPAIMADWRRHMRARFRAIVLIDRLIHALSAGDWS
ncbi:PRTRC system protein F [Xanthomonas hortorum]|uniref:PRTRC system protein F n=1 Tax=Xanthomonas hortorum pv. hederae TaxID=453603 RepID=A0A9X4BSI3_9XANT|nr:PRTRC system protein F [Xanthomonas hortorum]MCE4369730.1 PRTRC system protein F [Xanthomonas hortorum pv. hederae]MDC8638745.1 PRTRC system protein F [Xanthomonas hortorum pv. hederae]